MNRELVPIEKRAVSKAMLRRVCSVAGCDRGHRAHGLCEKHYFRLRRVGSTELPGARPRPNSGGYLVVQRPDHPLRQGKRSASEYLHRIVFYDARGVGPFCCHVCESEVSWSTLHIDHLNDDRADNRLENLAPACPTCNLARGRPKMVATMRAKHSTIVTFGGETLPLIDWSNRLGISRESLRARLAKWPLDRAMTEPRGRFGPKGLGDEA